MRLRDRIYKMPGGRTIRCHGPRPFNEQQTYAIQRAVEDVYRRECEKRWKRIVALESKR